jgi:hypothetical protein
MELSSSNAHSKHYTSLARTQRHPHDPAHKYRLQLVASLDPAALPPAGVGGEVGGGWGGMEREEDASVSSPTASASASASASGSGLARSVSQPALASAPSQRSPLSHSGSQSQKKVATRATFRSHVPFGLRPPLTPPTTEYRSHLSSTATATASRSQPQPQPSQAEPAPAPAPARLALRQSYSAGQSHSDLQQQNKKKKSLHEFFDSGNISLGTYGHTGSAYVTSSPYSSYYSHSAAAPAVTQPPPKPAVPLHSTLQLGSHSAPHALASTSIAALPPPPPPPRSAQSGSPPASPHAQYQSELAAAQKRLMRAQRTLRAANERAHNTAYAGTRQLQRQAEAHAASAEAAADAEEEEEVKQESVKGGARRALMQSNPVRCVASRLLCCAVLCCAVLCCAVLCCAVLAIAHALQCK